MKVSGFYRVLIKFSCSNGSSRDFFFGSHALGVLVEMPGRFGVEQS
jgi:hypothetical protein